MGLYFMLQQDAGKKMFCDNESLWDKYWCFKNEQWLLEAENNQLCKKKSHYFNVEIFAMNDWAQKTKIIKF